MSEKDSIRTQIHAFIVGKVPASRRKSFHDEVQLLGSGIIDSLTMLDVVAFIENSFGIKVLDEELMPENFGSVNSLVAFVDRKVSQARICAE